MEDIPKALSESILDSYEIIEVKINYRKDEYVEGSLAPPETIFSVLSYLNDLHLDIVYSTAGIHTHGKNQKPHLHYHLIVKTISSKTFVNDNSKHRNRWLTKEENKVFKFDGVTFRFPKQKEDPVWQVLSYPYKENLVCDHKPLQIISKKYQDFLIEYAVNVYQVSLGMNARKDACELRKQESLMDLGKLCRENRHLFNSYREMIVWLEDNFIMQLPLEKKPILANYRANCQRVGNSLGFFKYCDNI